MLYIDTIIFVAYYEAVWYDISYHTQGVINMTKANTLYQNIIEDIIFSIKEGKWKPGDKIPTELELTEYYNVSRITVSRATNELQTIGYLNKVKGTGTFVLNQERISVNDKLKLIPIILPLQESLGYDILRGAEAELKKQGYIISYHCTNFYPDEEYETISKLCNSGVSGLLVYPCSSYTNVSLFSSLMIKKIPLVFIDRSFDVLDIPYVTSNNFEASYNITKLLIEYGHTKIAFLSFDTARLLPVSQRYHGYCKALTDHGIVINEDYIIDTLQYRTDAVLMAKITSEDDYNLTVAKKLISIKVPPTAVVCINDQTAGLFIESLTQLGISVPNQMSVTGFDNIQFAKPLPVSLTTVEQQFHKMGAVAAKMLLSKIKSPKSEIKSQILDTRIIIRDSIKNISPSGTN